MSLDPTETQDQAGQPLEHTLLSGDDHKNGSQNLPITALEIGVIVGTVLAFAAGLFFVFYCRQSARAHNNNGGGAVEEAQRTAEEQGEELTTQSPKPHESTHWYMSVVQKLGMELPHPQHASLFFAPIMAPEAFSRRTPFRRTSGKAFG